jgi:small redox-active disulfide protein 2
MKIQILGTGCPKCTQLLENAKVAVREMGIQCEIEKITKMNDFLKFGVMITPALAVDGKVKSCGKVLSPDEIKKMLA